MTKKGMPTTVVWSAESLLAFEVLKARMTAAPVLVLPETGSIAKFVLVTDASNVGIGAVLLQDQGGGLQPVEYFARKLNSAEVSYPAYDLEALAATAAVNHWRHYLEGCQSVKLVTDHATLVHLLKQAPSSLSKRQVKYVEILQPYANYLELVYRKGEVNEADLSGCGACRTTQGNFSFFGISMRTTTNTASRAVLSASTQHDY